MLRRSLRPVNQAQRKPKGGGRLRPLSRAGRACTFGPSAGVAEWQTRQTQNLLPVREWGFKSLHPHQLKSDTHEWIARNRHGFTSLTRPPRPIADALSVAG